MAYDDVISHVGGFGLYQKGVLFLLCLPIIISGFYLENEHANYYRWEVDWKQFFAAGVLLGGLIFGLMSDKLGRKPTYQVAQFSLLIFSVAVYFVEGVLDYDIAQLIIGGLSTGMFLVSFVLAIEIVGHAHRKYSGIIVMVYYTTFACRFWLKMIRDQFPWVHIVLIGLSLLFLSYYWLIPESGRWQQVMGRKQSAVETSLKTAHINYVQINTQALYTLLDLKVKQELKGSSSIWDRLRSPNFICTMLLALLVWFANSLVARYFVYRLLDIPDHYIRILTIELVPTSVVILLAIDRLGRRIILSGSMIFVCLGILLFNFSHFHIEWVELTSFIFIYFSFSLSFVTLHIFTAEQLPTVIRTSGLGIFFSVGGSQMFLSFYYMENEYVIIILVAFGILSLLLPETLAKPLPETFEDTKNARIRETSEATDTGVFGDREA